MSNSNGKKPPNTHASRPVVAEGVLFASYNEADSKLGFAHGRTKYRVQNGWPGYYEPQNGPKPCRKGHRMRLLQEKPRPVVASGTRYDSLAEATAALSVPKSTIHRRIKAGWPGYYFVDQR